VRIVIFTDYDNTATLIEATLTEVAKRPGSEVVAVYTSTSRLVRPRRVLSSSRRMLEAVARGQRPRRSGRVSTLCRRWGVPLLMVPDGDPNAPAFLDDVRSRWHPDLALSYWSTVIFGTDWLDAFDHAVNFHDGRIPDHRGLGATMMELYDGLESGGFTFHHIDSGIDTGNGLVDGTVPSSGLALMELVEAKLVAAGRRVGDLLDLVEAGDPGREQEDGGSYTSANMLDELTTIDDPAALCRAELQLRIDAFGSVVLPLPGGPGPVTRLARRRGLGWPRVQMADGSVTVSRVAWLPAAGYLIGRAIRGVFRKR
jgi:methionyl-tRNA formyltransferase